MRCGLVLTCILGFTTLCVSADTKGFCPKAPPKPKVVKSSSVPKHAPPTPDAQFAGTVSLFAVISDKGYVCSVELLHGFDKNADQQALKQVRQTHFTPARKDGRPVPVVVTLQLDFWRTPDGKLVPSPAGPEQ